MKGKDMDIILKTGNIALSDALLSQAISARKAEGKATKARDTLCIGFDREGWTSDMLKAPRTGTNDPTRIARWAEAKAMAAAVVSVKGKTLTGNNLARFCDKEVSASAKLNGIQKGGKTEDGSGTWNSAVTSQLATWHKWLKAYETARAEGGTGEADRRVKTTREYIATRFGEIVKRLTLDAAKTEPDNSLPFPLAKAGEFERAMSDVLVRFGFKECAIKAEANASPAPAKGKGAK